MAKILISGLVNTETSVRVRQFPVEYYPIDYAFFGVNTAVSGVACNIALAAAALGDDVKLLSMTGQDFAAEYVKSTMEKAGVDMSGVKEKLLETPSSVVLYDGEGRRQIYCDLKDIQETDYDFTPEVLDGVDIVAACNINFNRPLLSLAKAAGKTVATDVHVFNNIWDEYNRDFLEAADIVFLSDEHLGDDFGWFLKDLAHTWNIPIVVLGRGSKGAAMYLKTEDRFVVLPAAHVGQVINTVGAGDALFTAFVHYYAKGFGPEESLRRAIVFAAAKIRVSGASLGFVSEGEVEEMLSWN